MFDGDKTWGAGPGLHLRNGATLTRTFPHSVMVQRIELQQIHGARYGNNYWRGDFSIELLTNGAWTRVGHVDDVPVGQLQMESDGLFVFNIPATTATGVRMVAGNPTRGNGEIFRLEELQVFGSIHPPPADGLLNYGQQCWHSDQCNRQGGYCPSFCGTGRCCRAGHVYSEREREECGEEGFGLDHMHTCQPPAEAEEPEPDYDCRLSAYWEYGSCGCGGNDQNQNWCGGIGSGDCPDTIETSICPSGTAYLAEWHPKPYANGHQRGHAGHLVRDGCEYIWHAQYACQEEPDDDGSAVSSYEYSYSYEYHYDYYD